MSIFMMTKTRRRSNSRFGKAAARFFSTLAHSLRTGLVAVAALIVSWTPPATALESYTSGHADLAVYNSGTDLQLRYHFASSAIIDGNPVGGSGRIADPALINTVIPNSSTILIPDDPAYSAYWRNRNTWYLPPGSITGVPFLGLGNETASGVFTGDQVTLSLDSIVSRPAAAEFMLVSSNGVPVYMDTASDTSPDQLVIPTHDHYYWIFSQVGTYQFNFRASAVIQATGQSTSTVSTFTFTVVPEPATWKLAGVGILIAGVALRRKSRQPAAR